jgi:O-antigen chain-terminating methyltransferase
MNLPAILKNIQIAENTVFSSRQRAEAQAHAMHCQLNLLRDYIVNSQDQLIDQIKQAASKKDLLAMEQHQRQLLDESNGRLLEIISKENHLDDRMSLAFMDKFRGSREEIKDKQAIYLPYINRALEQSKADKILDIGSGRGEWLELLRDYGHKGSGVDMNRVLVEQCKEAGLDVHCVDGLNYLQAQPAQSLAAITGFHIVEHLPLQTLLLLFDECFRVLSPGGIAIFETPNPENLVTGACDFYFDPTHRKPLPPKTLHFLIEAGGGRDAQIIRCHANDDVRVDDKTVAAYLAGPRDYSVLAWK